MRRIAKALRAAGEVAVFAGVVAALVLLMIVESIRGARDPNGKCDDWWRIHLER